MATREATPPAAAVQPNGPGNAAAPDEPEESSGGPGRRIIFIAVGVIVVILLAIWGIRAIPYMLTHQGTDDARIDADAVAVTSKINEKIDQILVTTNQPVHRGQLLMILDNKDELAKLAQAKAQYDLAVTNQRTNSEQNVGGVSSAGANVAGAQAQVPAAEAGVAEAVAQERVARAQLPAAAAAMVKARADFARTQSLVSTGDEPAAQLDSVRSEQASAAAQLRSAQDQINAAQANVDASQQRVNAYSAGVGAAQGSLTTAQGKLAQSSDPSQVESAKAQLDLAKQNLNYTHIYSAIDGFVGEKNAEIGQTIGAGATLMTLIPHNIYVTANYKETQMGNMRVGQPADITVDAYKGVTFHGHLESINPASQNTYALVPAQNATGNFVKVTQRIPVRITIDDPRDDMPLRPGMSVETYVGDK
jgi:membrane fusion protein, multidrug efflux system